MLEEQGGLCAICRGPQAAGYAHFDVDHDAQTGKVRGLLCRRCNITLGLIESGRVNAALSYLARATE